MMFTQWGETDTAGGGRRTAEGCKSTSSMGKCVSQVRANARKVFAHHFPELVECRRAAIILRSLINITTSRLNTTIIASIRAFFFLSVYVTIVNLGAKKQFELDLHIVPLTQRATARDGA